VGRKRKRGTKKRRKKVDAVDVLDGRVKVGMDELIDLIHTVNPTDRRIGRSMALFRPSSFHRLSFCEARRHL
jgi:hypothetical protein